MNSVDALSLLLLLLLVVTIAAAFERLHQHCFNSNFESMAQKQIVQFRKKLTNYLRSFSVAFSWLQLIRFVAYCRRIISLFIFHSVKCLDFNAVCSCCNFYFFFFLHSLLCVVIVSIRRSTYRNPNRIYSSSSCIVTAAKYNE